MLDLHCVGDAPVFPDSDASTALDGDRVDTHEIESAEAATLLADRSARDGPDAVGPDGTAGDAGDADSQPCDPTSPFSIIEPVGELNGAGDDEGSRLTPDELVIYYTSRPALGQPFQIFSATRASRNDTFGRSSWIPLLGNSSGAMIAPDRMLLYYSSDRGGLDENAHLYVARSPFSASTSVALGKVNSTSLDYAPYVSADGAELYFVSTRPANLDDNLYVATRSSDGFAHAAAVPIVNSAFSDRSPVVSADGLRLYFGSNRGSRGDDFDIYLAHRADRTQAFEDPQPMTQLNTPGVEMPDWVAPDECAMYFRSDRPGGAGGRDVWRARREPSAAR
jgi:Tol biopolymer transport system component